jgi:hypothetical protein
MHQVLDAVDDDRRGGADHLEEPLHPQHVLAVGVQQHRQPDAERGPVERPLEGRAEGVDVGGMPLGRPPPPRGRPGFGKIGHVAGEQLVRAERVDRVVVDRRRRIVAAADGPDRRRLRRPGEIGLGQHHPIGHGHLLHRLFVLGQLPRAVDGVDRGHHVLDPEMMPQHGVAHQGEDDRRRVGQAGGLDDEAVEGRNLAPLPLAVELADGCAEIVADRAADAAAGQHHGGLVDVPQQQVIQGHLAELVDQHRRVGEPGGGQQSLQQRRLAAAQEAGDDVDGDQVGSPPSRAASKAGSRGSQRRPAIRSATGHRAARCWTISDRPVRLPRT